jgi:hypothetical protein
MAAVTALAALAPIADGDRYGAGAGAVCGTDGQCAAYSIEVLHVAPDGYGANDLG